MSNNISKIDGILISNTRLFHSSSCLLLDRDDDGPNHLADHFLAVLVKLRQHSWTHYLSENLTKLKSFNAKNLQTFRGFDSEPQPVWLASHLLQRSVKSAFSFLIQLYSEYNINRCVPFISGSFGQRVCSESSNFSSDASDYVPKLGPQEAWSQKEMQPPRRCCSATRLWIDDIIWEGITPKRIVAVYCRWKGYAESANSWQPLNEQSLNFIEWWNEEVEMRYPLCRPVEYQVPLTRFRNGAFSRS